MNGDFGLIVEGLDKIFNWKICVFNWICGVDNKEVLIIDEECVVEEEKLK